MSIEIRPMTADDIAPVNDIIRLAFGTFLGVPEPAKWAKDRDYGRVRYELNPSAAFVATDGSRLIGSNFGTRWGTVAFFGPLTVHPEYWDKGVGQKLLEPVLACFEEWRPTQAGLFTFSHSPKHHALYQKYGFWPRYLTTVLEARVERSPAAEYRRISVAPGPERACLKAGIANVCDAIWPGLDLSREIDYLVQSGMGDTVVVQNQGEVSGFAVCHCGSGSEAGENVCFVKFGGVKPGPGAADAFKSLLGAVEHFAFENGGLRVSAGVNQARREAYCALLNRGYRALMSGVAMHRPDEPGYSRSDRYVIDDWR